MNVESLSAIADQQIQESHESMKEFRTNELTLFREKGFHSPILDAYKFTNLASFFEALPYEPKSSDKEGHSIDADFIFTDGVLVFKNKTLQDVSVKSLKENFKEVKNLLKDSNALSHLHHSFLNDGIILEVPKNKVIDAPIRIVHYLTKAVISAPLVVVIAHHFSKLTLIEETISESAPYAYINETYLFAHENAKIEHIQLDRGGKDGVNHSSLFAEAQKDATIRSFMFNTSGRLNRKNLTMNLNASGAHGESYSLYLTSLNEHSDINTVINHIAADTTSAQIAKGILDDESKGIFTGKIHIHPQAQRVASSQLNKNLLLSKKAQVHSQPQLEIFADDVKCSHGSTTGQLSDDEIFYFQARGIPASKAKTLLAHGFGLEVVQKIENTAARELVSPVIMANLETKFQLRGI